MKLLRISASMLAFTAITLLAACGGGGGGGGVTPPGGGGGGGTPPPSSTPSPAPSTSPTTPPGGGITASSTVYVAYDSTPAHSWGGDNWQTNGVTAAPDAGDGNTSTGGNGSNTIDGVSCSLPNGEATGTYYHVHAFVGIYVNGNAYAVPDAVGMVNPDSNEPILTFKCAYNIHTHADSGIIHVEDPTIASSATPPAQYNLQTLFDIWGQNLGAIGITGAAGMPSIYVGSPCANLAATCASPQKNSAGQDLVNSYTLVTGSPSSVLLQHHIAIWLIYGTPPANVPQIAFGIAN